MKNETQWPEDLWPLAEAKDWIAAAIPGSGCVEGPTQIYNVKKWGVTAEFKCDGEPVVFKGCKLSLFANRTATERLLSRCCSAYVPALLDCKELLEQETWTLHRAFYGRDVEQTQKFENILEMTRTLAKIQTIVAERPSADRAKLSQTPLEQIPAMLDYMLQRIANSYLAAWLADDAAILQEYALLTNVLEELESFRPKVAHWTQELLDGDWPLSIDHLDFNISNAVMQENGQCLIFDWEEATMSSPFFSIDRLLYDADAFEADPQSIPQTEGHLRLTPNQMAICNAYIDALPWHTRPQRQRAFDLAMCLAPIKTAYECEPFNEALGRVNGFPALAAHCFGRALHFWNAMEGAKSE